MGLAIRNLKGDLSPKILCDHCHSTIESTEGEVFFQSEEPYATRLWFCHRGFPCSPKDEKKSDDSNGPIWKHLSLEAFMVHFLKKFMKSEVTKKVPLRLVEQAQVRLNQRIAQVPIKKVKIAK